MTSAFHLKNAAKKEGIGFWKSATDSKSGLNSFFISTL